MTHRKPSPWSKRASLRGSVPDAAEARLRASSPELRWNDLLWRITSYFILLYALKVIVVGLLRMFGVPVSLGWLGDFLTYIFILFAIMMLTMSVFRRIGRCRLRRRVLDARGYLCPICTYNLQGLGDDEPQCPECGSITPRRECVLLWCQFMRSKD